MRKTIITTAVLIGFFSLISGLGIIASVPYHAHKSAKELVRQEIINYISCPDFVTENSELNTVKAIVSVDEQGKVSVGEINTGNPKLKDYVLGRLQNLEVKNPAGAEKFVLVIHFRVE